MTTYIMNATFLHLCNFVHFLSHQKSELETILKVGPLADTEKNITIN